MTATIDDYQHALDRFLADMKEIEGLVSLLLYGSLATGKIQPGRSDLVDAYVYLQPEVFEDKTRFLSTLEHMVEACERLSLTSLPFHPFHYFSCDELGSLPAVYLSTWKDKSTRVLLGQDIRGQIGSTEASLSVARTSFFNARRSMCHFLSLHLKKDLTAQDSQNIVKSLVSIRKFIPLMACYVLDIWTISADAIVWLEKALPGLDTSVLQKIENLRDYKIPTVDASYLREVLRATLLFIETLHDRLILELRRGPEVSEPSLRDI